MLLLWMLHCSTSAVCVAARGEADFIQTAAMDVEAGLRGTEELMLLA